jgi:hypothetical protein
MSGAYIALAVTLGTEMLVATPVIVLIVVDAVEVDEVVDEVVDDEEAAELELDEEAPVDPVEPTPVTVVVKLLVIVVVEVAGEGTLDDPMRYPPDPATTAVAITAPPIFADVAIALLLLILLSRMPSSLFEPLINARKSSRPYLWGVETFLASDNCRLSYQI